MIANVVVMSEYRKIQKQMMHRAKQDVQNISFFGDHCYTITISKSGETKTLTYNPHATLLQMHHDTTDASQKNTLWAHVMGPYGSGKSVGTISNALFRARNMPKCNDGIRRYKALVTRSTYPNLKNTTWQTWLAWFGELGDVQKNEQPPMTYKATFNDGAGLIEFSAVFVSLEHEQDIDKLKSLEVTDVIVNEISEMNPVFFDHFIGRADRYPRRVDLVGGLNYQGIVISDTNAPDDDSVLYSMFETNRPAEYKIYKQPPGLLRNAKNEWVKNPNAENLVSNGGGLSDDYYTNLAKGKSDEFIKVFCCGEYGVVSTGKAVYTEYNDDLHSSDALNYIQSLPINFCWDYGLTPCCAVFQVDALGRINVLREYTSQSIGLENFVKSVLPQLNVHFPNWQKGISVGDPAGTQRAQSNEKTCMQVLGEQGIKTLPAYSNAIMERIEAVKKALSQLVDGRPMLMIARDCKTLRKGFIGHYEMVRVKDSTREEYKSEPKKNFYSHIHDALQYGVMTVLKQAKSNNDELSIEEKRRRSAQMLARGRI